MKIRLDKLQSVRWQIGFSGPIIIEDWILFLNDILAPYGSRCRLRRQRRSGR